MSPLDFLLFVIAAIVAIALSPFVLSLVLFVGLLLLGMLALLLGGICLGVMWLLDNL
jgi:hypothetical protein